MRLTVRVACREVAARKKSKDERTLEEEVENLRVRIEAGEADVDVATGGEDEEGGDEDGGEEENTAPEQLTVQKLMERKEAELAAMTARLDEEHKCDSSPVCSPLFLSLFPPIFPFVYVFVFFVFLSLFFAPLFPAIPPRTSKWASNKWGM